MRPRRTLAAAVCTWLSAASLVHAAWDCSALTVGGNSFDLSQVKGTHSWEDEVQTPPTVTKTRYTFSPCSSLPDPPSSAPDDDCPSGTRLCMRTFSSRSGLEDRLLSTTVVPVAGEIGKGEMEVKAGEKEGKKSKEEWVLEMGGGSYNGVEQRVRVDMKCDKGAKETSPTVQDYDSKAGVLSLSWTTFAACPTGNSDPPKEDAPRRDDDKEEDGGARDPVGKSGGMGFFSWFFTLLFLGLLGYFAIGSYHNYTTYGATGWDMIPHRDVWRDLPYVVSDLFKGRGGSRNGYSALG
ncbi:RHTO0S06e03576g1_1 [Rhodotorula toruloides]|uniref:Autophagy-related protein 27 n=1 Tax=Rhodotorula toruloides TaxID=5286 RepID=A0A061B1V3_RHOTO|nr:RHTO0S06e03576g1_1 [Rhodotorula toruloides]